MGSELRSAARVTKGDDGLNLSPENADEVVARRLIAEELGTAIDEAKTTLDRVGNAMGAPIYHPRTRRWYAVAIVADHAPEWLDPPGGGL